MNSKMLLEVAEYLKAQASAMAAVERLVPQATQTPATNIYAHSKPSYGPVPAEFQNPKDPYGSRPDIGSPGWQAMLRLYAADDKVGRNTFIREKGLTPIWPDEKQDWEAR